MANEGYQTYPERSRPFRFLTLLVIAGLGLYLYNQLYQRAPRLVSAVGLGTKKVVADNLSSTFQVAQPRHLKHLPQRSAAPRRFFSGEFIEKWIE